MTTIRDVARLAAVSVSTVSYALTGERPISAATRARVLVAARSLGYQPNALATSLKTGRSMTLGLIIPDILNPFFTVIACAAEDAARAQGYSLVLCNSANDAEREQEYLQLLRSRRVDGLIYMAGSSVPHATLRALVQQGFPLVLIDEELSGIDAASLAVRNYEGGAAVGAHLAELGHRCVGVIGGPPALRTAQARLAGLLAGLALYGVQVPPERLLVGDYQLESGQAAARRLLDADPAISALFAANDLMALGALREAQSRRLAIPGAVSIAGFDDIPLASLVSPALTTVSQPAQTMGEQAIALLLAQIQGRCASSRQVVFGTHLRVRGSTGPLLAPRWGARERGA